MPRAPRCLVPGATYHLISRFVDREWFINQEEERDYYLRLLGRAIERSDWRLMAYAVMSNHIHLAAVVGQHKLDTWIRGVHSPFADTMNRTYGRIGGMFVRGPKAKFVEAEAVGSLIAYIHNNPVRAGLCDSAAGSRWTSHRAYVGASTRPAWLDVEEGMRRAGFADRRAFDTWVGAPERAPFQNEFAKRAADDIDSETAKRILTPPVKPTDTTPTVVVEATAAILGISVAQLCSSSRGPEEVLGRALAVRVAVSLGVPGQRIASALQISQQRASVLRRSEPEPKHAVIFQRIIDAVGDEARAGK